MAAAVEYDSPARTKIISWNIDSINTLGADAFVSFVSRFKPDILCFQEIKVRKSKYNLPDAVRAKYPYEYWNDNGGYSGTLVLSKIPAKKVEISPFDTEGRIITLDFAEFNLINVYTPNSGRKLARLDYRTKEWEPEFLKYVQKKQRSCPVVVVGDLNVCHDPKIDIWNSKYKDKAGTTPEERACFESLIGSADLVDSFRHKHPRTRRYSYWSYYANARDNNKGWRLDYALVSRSAIDHVLSAGILTEEHGSDHCPIEISLSLRA